jgi:hypothetical protein
LSSCADGYRPAHREGARHQVAFGLFGLFCTKQPLAAQLHRFTGCNKQMKLLPEAFERKLL